MSLCNGKRPCFPTACLHVSTVSYLCPASTGSRLRLPRQEEAQRCWSLRKSRTRKSQKQERGESEYQPWGAYCWASALQLAYVNGFCIFIPDWVKKASNFSKSQIFSVFFFLVFWRCADHHNRDTIPSQGRGGQRHAQHSGHFFQQWQFHIKTGAVLLYSYLENTRLRWWDFMSYYLLRICVSISFLKQCSERIAALWKTPKTEYNNNIPISQDLLFMSLCFVFNITNHYFK